MDSESGVGKQQNSSVWPIGLKFHCVGHIPTVFAPCLTVGARVVHCHVLGKFMSFDIRTTCTVCTTCHHMAGAATQWRQREEGREGGRERDRERGRKGERGAGSMLL